MSFTTLVEPVIKPSEIKKLFKKIKKDLPASPSEIARLLGKSLKTKEQKNEFGHLLNFLVYDGLIFEKNRVFHNAKIKKPEIVKTQQPSQAMPKTLIGVVHVNESNVIFEPLDGDLNNIVVPSDLVVADGSILEVQLSDDLSNVEKILQRHGNMSDENAIGKISALAVGIPIKFPDDILSDTPSLEIPPVSNDRKDFRKIPFITIDPVDAKDFDDAICVRRIKNGWTVMVAIADVSHYVQPGTKLALEALKRGNSTYLPDMVIPMLPEELSNGVCSLKPNEDRACMVCTMDIDKQGNILNHKYERGLMKSKFRLNYDQVQEAIESESGRKKLPRGAWGYIQPALEVYNARLKDKKRRGALEINAAEQRISIGRGRDISLALEVGNEAHGIIEELMIAANQTTGEVLDNGNKSIYRVHGVPSERVLREMSGELAKLGINIPRQGDVKSRIKKILDQAPDCNDPDQAYVLVTRMQAQAFYTTEPAEHFGLALKRYTHFTSPIRRATDWFVHSCLNEEFNLSGGYKLSDKMKKRMEAMAKNFSRTERRSQAAERECQNRIMAMWMKRNISNTFNAVVTHNDGKKLFLAVVEKDDISIKTVIARKELPNRVDSYSSGDRVDIKPVEANPVTGIIKFEMV